MMREKVKSAMPRTPSKRSSIQNFASAARRIGPNIAASRLASIARR